MCEGVQGTLFIAVLGSRNVDRQDAGGGCIVQPNGAPRERGAVCRVPCTVHAVYKEGRSQGRPGVAFELRSTL